MTSSTPLSTKNFSRLYLKLFLTLFVVISFITLAFGEIPFQDLLLQLIHSPSSWNALRDERLPRLIVLALSGASLAVSGATMQALFQNPVASPSVLGISIGGSLLVTIILATGIHLSYPLIWPISAIFGCLLALIVVYGLARYNGAVQIHQLLITGIAISILLSTIQAILTYAMRDKWELMLYLTEWEAGSSYHRSWNHVNMQLPIAAIGLYGCWRYSHELDILALGDEEALNLGVDIKKVRWRLFLCIALLLGGTIAAIGIIAFYGLMIPHLFRKLIGPNNNLLIPLCMIGGAAILPGLDLGLRLFKIYYLTVGNVSAILGGIFFFLLIFGQKGRWQRC